MNPGTFVAEDGTTRDPKTQMEFLADRHCALKPEKALRLGFG